MDYKKTLNLPKTKFSMKANLVQKEPEILKLWDEIDIYKLVNKKTSGRPSFVLHDGPPYANGDIHLGHTINKVLKDIIVKYKSMKNFYSPFVPGWDCHGQPIEHNVEKSLGSKKSEINQVQLRKLCKEYALKFVKRQAEQFKRLGIRGDFENPYLTLRPLYEATNIEVFGKLYEEGYIYKGKKPIHWCYHCETALAEAEIEYDDEKSPSIYVKFPFKSDFAKLSDYRLPKYFLIWTTTPWTLPANVAIAVNPKLEYAAVEVGGEIYILANDLIKGVLSKAGISHFKVLKTFTGCELENLVCLHPFQPWDSKVILADFVALDTGSGCVHIAPGHGQEDYQVGLAYKLPILMPVDDKGFFTKQAGKYAGQHVEKANETIVADLKKENFLFYASSIVHSYPHCWRCKKPVIFRATEQWFVSMDNKNFRENVLNEIKKVKWMPEWSEKRITGMVKDRPDWCISRQRSWGVPIPVFYCSNCRKEIVTKETINAIIELFKEEGADAWFIKSADEILPKGTICPDCKGTEFIKENDILDVWFESGVSHFAVLRNRPELIWPAQMYLEGTDQHRGWFQSSLLTSVGCTGRAPYDSVLTHGFLVDGNGRKMSKSLGNVVDPLEVIKKSGADILRLWVASADYSTDVAVSGEILERIAEAYRRIRNTLRFIMGNLCDFNPQKDKIHYEDMEEIDRWAISRLQKLIEDVTQAFDKYKFYFAYHAIYNFCVTDLSSFYLDVLKDRLYTSSPTSKERRSSQTAFHEILMSLIGLLAPVLAFTAEDAWMNLDDCYKTEVSVHLTNWPSVNREFIDDNLEKKWGMLLRVRAEILKALEIARSEKLIGNPLEAMVTIYCDPDLFEFLSLNQDVLSSIFIVSQVELASSDSKKDNVIFLSEEIPNFAILISKAKGKKCERCWNYSKSVGANSEHPTICSKCLDVIKNMTE
ncbi:isoleucine--tRNA ligase [Candidatus Oleimmundimicrobium sp.]|uniref:isoleucine--tRNA ligase n=1 Tax=Candidatus Oleimmundimicrobium sp. TaxID=3060597 RepID=UPI002721D127|nr:isoleucine--tRNA ligase [Candidatus Oleimmundimicrobium sp.]MDO8885521.1 isoleucine--tRNA ligase [Candidatus Oleimmundimicrobium sp.]